MDKDTIKRNFSQCAACYDMYSDIQNKCTLKLIDIIEDKNPCDILEIGCGTGNYTRLLKNRFPDAYITAVDISPGMIEVAKEKFKNGRVRFYIEDGENLNIDKTFNLITSSSVFQWFDNPKSSFEKYSRMLTKNGTFVFSAFGPDTFKELQNVVSSHKPGASISAGHFISKQEIQSLLKSAFGESFIFEETITKRYASLLDMLKSIKYTGTRGDTKTDRLWTKNLLKSLQDIYTDMFGGITATYQIFFCKCKT